MAALRGAVVALRARCARAVTSLRYGICDGRAMAVLRPCQRVPGPRHRRAAAASWPRD